MKAKKSENLSYEGATPLNKEMYKSMHKSIHPKSTRHDRKKENGKSTTKI